MQRSSLLVGDGLECRSIHLAASMILRKVLLKKIHFGRVLVWCGVNWMIIHFSRASIPPSGCYSIHPFLQIILVQNSQCDNDSVPQAAATTLLSLLYLSFFYATGSLGCLMLYHANIRPGAFTEAVARAGHATIMPRQRNHIFMPKYG